MKIQFNGLSNLIKMLSFSVICVLFAFTMPSCKEEGEEFLNPLNAPSDVPTEEVPIGKEKGGNSFQAIPTAPNGWTIPETATNLKLFNKGVYYVVAVDLKGGGRVTPMYQTPSPSVASVQTPYPAFKSQDVLDWWSSESGNFAVANASFFNYTVNSQRPNGTTSIPHILKDGSRIVSCGHSCFMEYNQRHLTLRGSYATIDDGPAPMSTANVYTSCSSVFSSKNPIVMGGLHPLNANKDSTDITGRTMVGLRDTDGDGLKDVLYILVTKASKQHAAYNVLRNEFACDQTIMFDGSGSSQLVCKDKEYVKSCDFAVRRNFPVAFRVR